MQTQEDRIRRQYKALRKQFHGSGWHKGYESYYSVGEFIWMRLARQWKRPVQEIKRICRRGAKTT